MSLVFSRLHVDERTKELVTISNGDNRIKLHAVPFKIEFFKNEKLVSVVNARGLMNFEHLRERKQEQPA